MASSVDNGYDNAQLWNSNDFSKWSSPSVDGAQAKWKRMNIMGDSLPISFVKSQVNYRCNDDADREEVSQYFNKKFSFKGPALGWQLPLETDMYVTEKWKIDKLMDMKDELNHVKNKLNNYNLDDWHKHTRAMNKAGNVLWTIKKDIAPEFATQAWCKFFEICSSYEFIGQLAQDNYFLNSVHLCEAPGAFITSLNHYLKLNHPDMKWNWISTTLNPYYEGNPLSNMINDDRFILHTLDHWKFGYDYTGNLMDVNNLHCMVQEGKKLGAVSVVTADGSIDCQNNPGEQELIVSQLIFCEVVCALHILSTGGSFVVKMFTMYESETICLMYLLVCCFQSVNVHKPATSKEGNSEVYVVCLDYRGTDDLKPCLQKLRTQYKAERAEKAMFLLEAIPKDFLIQLHECAKKFKDYQVEVIERNIYLFNIENKQQSIKRTKRLRYMVAEEYKRRYNLKPLVHPEDEVVGQMKLKNTETPNMDPRFEEGTFNDRLKREKMAPLEKMKTMLLDIEKNRIKWQFGNIKWLEFSNEKNDSKFRIELGKPVTSVHSSKFCSGRLLKIRNDVRRIAKEHFQYQCSESSLAWENNVSKTLSPEIENIIQSECSEILKGREVRRLNYKDKLWVSLESGENERFERNAFFDFMEACDESWRESTLIVQGYPMLTQFTAGVIYTLGHLYEKVGFVRPNGQDFAVIFHGYRKWNANMNTFRNELDKKMEELETEKNVSVLSVIPLSEMIYGHEEFYTCVTAVNNLCVQEQISDIAHTIVNRNLTDEAKAKS